MCADESSWSQQKLVAYTCQHAVFLPQLSRVQVMAAEHRCSDEAVMRDVLHFLSVFVHGLAYGRQHSKDGEDSFVKVETMLTQAVIWAGMQPAAPVGLQVFAHGVMHRAVQAERVGYKWRWDRIYMNVGAYLVLMCVPIELHCLTLSVAGSCFVAEPIVAK